MTDKKIMELLSDVQRIFEDLFGCSAKKCSDGISKVIEIKELLLTDERIGSENQVD